MVELVLNGRMPGVARPQAILLVLDATNLGRNLALAAPVLSLGLPTLVVLNMADELRARGGTVDTHGLAAQLGTAVTLVSAARGEGVDTVRRFLEGTFAVPARIELPVIQNVPACRQWAKRIAEQ